MLVSHLEEVLQGRYTAVREDKKWKKQRKLLNSNKELENESKFLTFNFTNLKFKFRLK